MCRAQTCKQPSAGPSLYCRCVPSLSGRDTLFRRTRHNDLLQEAVARFLLSKTSGGARFSCRDLEELVAQASQQLVARLRIALARHKAAGNSLMGEDARQRVTQAVTCAVREWSRSQGQLEGVCQF